MRVISKELNLPVVSTSANLSGGKDPIAFKDVPSSILDAAAVAIDGGVTKYAQPSTILDLDEMKIVRSGAMKKELPFG